MIENKPRKCRGIGKAISVKGCGSLTLWRKYGLCANCAGDFLFGTDAGKMIMHTQIMPKAKNKVKANEKEKIKQTRESLKTKSDYEAILQKEINLIVKIIDAGWPCIATASNDGKRNAGHYISRGSNKTLSFHLENIWNQSEHSNSFKAGDTLRYREGITKLFGLEYLEYMDSLKSIPPLKLSIDEIKESIYKARSIVKWLKLQDRQYTLEERISLRKRFNCEIGIYV